VRSARYPPVTRIARPEEIVGGADDIWQFPFIADPCLFNHLLAR
jgi:hypothetical protein